MIGLCPDEAILARLAANQLSNAERAELLGHIETCDRCRRTVAVVVSSVAENSLEETPQAALPMALEPGVTLGPYHLVRLLGSGSMGTVFAAWDPRLDRQVALKVLHVDSVALREEARLMAKLSHPNIVTVHEVAEWQGRLVLVMQLISGGTLREWIATRPPLGQIVTVFAQLAHALAAAHAVGVVHRDFKPDNVLVDLSGVARLTDFGLGALSNELAESSSLVGTPAYLSPAQLDGRRGDESADQFAFCISLWEAVAGERPFRGATLAELRAAHHTRPTKPAGREFPRWLEAIVRRGLAFDPSARFPSMSALAHALSAGPPRWPWALAGATALSVALAAAAVQLNKDPCAGVGTELDAFDAPRARADRQIAFEATGSPFAVLAASETNRLLREYVGQWHTVAEATCRASPKPGAERAAAVQACLEVRRREFEELVVTLSRPALGVVPEAPAAVLLLRDLDSCLTQTRGHASSVERNVRLDIASLRHLIAVGRFREARDRLERVRAQSTSLDGGVALAELSWLDAHYALRLYDADATGRARECARRSLEVREDAIAAECLTYAAIAMSLRERKPVEARAALQLAQALYAREPRQVRHDVGVTIAEIHVARVEGRYDESLRITQEAVERFAHELGANHLHVLTLRGYLSMKLAAVGRFDEGYRVNSTLVEVMSRTLGDEHPATLVARNNQSFLARKVGRLEEARDAASSVLAIRAQTLGASNYGAMAAQLNLGAAEARLGNLGLAEWLTHEVARSVGKERGHDHFDMVEPLEELASLALARNRREEARDLFVRALAIRRKHNDSPFRIAETERALEAIDLPPQGQPR